ncbi:MAG: family 10 glycosylhydrolase, partial [Flavisolibacter sp.]
MIKSILFSILACTSLLVLAQPKKEEVRPEFRGVWIASVDNIDWPKKGQYNSNDQKAEFIRQMDLHQANGMNAVIVQVRP